MAADNDDRSMEEGGEGQDNAADRIDQLWRNRNNQTTQKEAQDARVAPDVPSQHLGTSVQGSHVEADDLQGAAADEIGEAEGQSGREQEQAELGEVDGATGDRSASDHAAVEGTEDGELSSQGSAFDAGDGLSFDTLDRGSYERSPLTGGIDVDAVAADEDTVDGAADGSGQSPDAGTASAGIDLASPATESSNAGMDDSDEGNLVDDLTADLGLPQEPVNIAPDDLVMSGGSVLENAVAGTVVAQIRGIDLNIGDRLTYALIDDAGGLFAIDPATGEVTVAEGAVLDLESAAAHDIQVTVTDAGGLSRTEAFTIDLANVNEGPLDLVLEAGGSVLENAAAGTVVAQITGTDPDAGDVLTYSLADDAGGLFAIDPATGEVTVAEGAVLDLESAAAHDIQVTVTDAGGLSRTEAFTIDLANVNEGPLDLVLEAGGSVLENAAAGTVVAQITGTDPDAGDVLTYSLADDAGGLFAIDPETGEVTVAEGAVLDLESAAAHDIQVTVTDAGGLSPAPRPSPSISPTSTKDPSTWCSRPADRSWKMPRPAPWSPRSPAPIPTPATS